MRVDDRLVHGQVMVGWREHLGANQVLVASDRLAANPMAARLLRLTSPTDVSLVIDSVEGLCRRLLAGEFSAKKDILLFESLADILKALDLGLRFPCLNLGGLRHHDSHIAFSPSVSLSLEDIEKLREIVDRRVSIEIQMLPREKPVCLDQTAIDRRVKE